MGDGEGRESFLVKWSQVGGLQMQNCWSVGSKENTYFYVISLPHMWNIFFFNNQSLSGRNRTKRTWILSHRIMHFLSLCEELNIIRFLRLQLIFNKRVSLSIAFLHKKISGHRFRKLHHKAACKNIFQLNWHEMHLCHFKFWECRSLIHRSHLG